MFKFLYTVDLASHPKSKCNWINTESEFRGQSQSRINSYDWSGLGGSGSFDAKVNAFIVLRVCAKITTTPSKLNPHDRCHNCSQQQVS